jgi:hypothetical protein
MWSLVAVATPAAAQQQNAVAVGARVRVSASGRDVIGAWRGADSAALHVLEGAQRPVTTVPRSTVQRLAVSEGVVPGNFGRGAKRGALIGLGGGVLLFALAAWHDAVTPRSTFWTPVMTAAITGAVVLPPAATMIGGALTRHDTERWRAVPVP